MGGVFNENDLKRLKRARRKFLLVKLVVESYLLYNLCMNLDYDHKKIEAKWRLVWRETGLFQNLFFGEDAKKVTAENKCYILPQWPYPSGSGLHMGHSEVYSACDIYSRYLRMKGKKVLQVVGWDSFGLPAENYAIKTNVHPKINTDKAIDSFREQIKSLGISVDWQREVGSHNPDYYKFTQWFFLLMYQRGLAYRKKRYVNWCDSCKTVLANEQVESGKCERCGTEIKHKKMDQWFLRITQYADRLIDDLAKVDWPKETIRRQRDWIGRSEGAEITFEILSKKEKVDSLTVFTTAHDTIYGATFIVLSPHHPFLKKHKKGVENWQNVEVYIEESSKKSDLERQKKDEKDGVELKGIYAINPVTKKKMPIFTADYVLLEYGKGAIMAVPGHDNRDLQFAKKYGLNVIFIESGMKYVSYSGEITDRMDKHFLANSEEFNGMSFYEARPKIFDKLKKMQVAKYKVEYKLHDWNVSRQRFWGAPIPMVYDETGKVHPVQDDDLPVLLPDDVNFIPTGRSPLTYSEKFQKGVEEKYGEGWRREVDTLDTFMCSSWYFFRYLDPKNDKEFASKENIKRWMPVDFYLGGPEHVNGHLLYSRFFTKVLFDAGYINFTEPFLVHRHQGMILGSDNRKMSKRWGNVINPTDVVNKYGGDTARMYLMFMGPLTADKPWDTNGMVGIRRFIARVYRIAINNIKREVTVSSKDLLKALSKTIKKVGGDIEKLKFNTAIATMMEFVNLWERDSEGLNRKDIEKFIMIFAPFAPFVSEDLYQFLINSSKNLNKKDSKSSSIVPDNFTSVHVQLWPEYDDALVKEDTVSIVVQVNGKMRGLLSGISINIAENEVRKQAKKVVETYLKGKEVKREVYVPQRLINFVTN